MTRLPTLSPHTQARSSSSRCVAAYYSFVSSPSPSQTCSGGSCYWLSHLLLRIDPDQEEIPIGQSNCFRAGYLMPANQSPSEDLSKWRQTEGCVLEGSGAPTAGGCFSHMHKACLQHEGMKPGGGSRKEGWAQSTRTSVPIPVPKAPRTAGFPAALRPNLAVFSSAPFAEAKSWASMTKAS